MLTYWYMKWIKTATPPSSEKQFCHKRTWWHTRKKSAKRGRRFKLIWGFRKREKGRVLNWSCVLWPVSPFALACWIFFCICTAEHKSSSFLLLPLYSLFLERGMWLSAGHSPALPSGRIRPTDMTTLYFAVHSFSKWGTSPGSTTVLRAPRASFSHSLIRLTGSPIWQSCDLCSSTISGLKEEEMT